ncbi:MAG: hypothetical protein II224_04080, partial [Ruminococcus sp.]|nr:hypothetical protein [Ruminococcus sp.]
MCQRKKRRGSDAQKYDNTGSADDDVPIRLQENEEFVGFGTMHADYEDIKGEVERIIKLGLLGIKLHTDFQGFAIDDDSALPIYEAARGQLPILFHVGDTKSDLSAPERVAKICEM